MYGRVQSETRHRSGTVESRSAFSCSYGSGTVATKGKACRALCVAHIHAIVGFDYSCSTQLGKLNFLHQLLSLRGPNGPWVRISMPQSTSPTAALAAHVEPYCDRCPVAACARTPRTPLEAPPVYGGG